MINDILTEDRRLVILRALMDSNNEATDSILQHCQKHTDTTFPARWSAARLTGWQSSNWSPWKTCAAFMS